VEEVGQEEVKTKVKERDPDAARDNFMLSMNTTKVENRGNNSGSQHKQK